VFEVVATAETSALGGDDFDAGARGLGARAERQLPIRRRTAGIARCSARAKEKLSSADQATLACPLAVGELAVRVTRDEFDAITRAWGAHA